MNLYLKRFFLGLLALALVGCGGPSEPVNETEGLRTQESKIATVVFSSDMESGGECHDHYTEGCDIFSAEVDLSTGAVTNIKQLTNDDFADIFPKVSQDGQSVFYTKADGKDDLAMEVSVEGGTPRTLARGANHPFPSADGSQVYFTLTKGYFLAALNLLDSTAVFQKFDTLMSTHEPQVSPTGFIGFYRSTPGSGRGSNTSQAMVYIPSTGEIVEVSEADGTAHCFWNYDGSALYCNNAGVKDGGIFAFPISPEGEVGEREVAIRFPTVEVLEPLDAQFTDECIITSVAYGSFCDDTHVLLTAACYTADQVDGEREQAYTQVVILDTESGEYLPVGKNLVEAYGSAEGTTWVGSCELQG